MEKNIVYRINELMGNQKFLLRENAIGELVEKLAKLLKVVPGGVQNGRLIRPIYKFAGEEVDLNTFNRIKQAVDNNNTSILNLSDVKLIAKALVDNPNYAKAIDDHYEFVVGKFIQNKNVGEERFIKELTKEWLKVKNTGITFQDFLTGQFPNSSGPIFREQSGAVDYFTIYTLRDKLLKKVDKYIKDRVVDVEIKRVPLPNSVSNTLNAKEIAKILKKIENPNATFWKDAWQLYKKSFDQLETEIQALSNGFIKDMFEKKGDPQELIDAYSAMISRKLDLMSIKNKKKMIDFLDGDPLPDELATKLKEGDGWFEVFRNSRSVQGEGFRSNLKSTFTDFFKNFTKKNLKGLINPKNPNFILYLNNSISQFFVTGQWGTLSSLWKKAIKMSPGEAKWKLMKYIVISVLASLVGYVVGAGVMTVINAVMDLSKILYDKTIVPLANKMNVKLAPFDVKGAFREQNDLFKALFLFLFKETWKGFEDNASRRGWETFFSTLPVIGITQTYSDSALTEMAEFFATKLLGKGQPVTASGIIDLVYSIFGVKKVEGTPVPIATVDTPRTTTPSPTTPTTITTTPSLDSIPRNRTDSNTRAGRDSTPLPIVPGFENN